jgi:ribosomal protein S18 acetylase RimI-like enzyme
MEKIMLHLSRDLMLQIEEAEKDCWTTYLSGVQKIPGNPLGVQISTVGHSTAFLVEASQSQFFNKALGFGIEHIDYIDALLDFYHSNDKMCTVEIIPLPEYDDLLLALAKKGLYNSGYTVMLYKSLENITPNLSSKLQINRVQKEDSSLLADIHVTGFEFQGDDAQQEHLIVKEGYNNEKFKSYIAKSEGVSIGAGTLFVHKDIGVLFGGATVPQYRGKGCQRALLEYRINEAMNLGCKLLVSHTNTYSASQRNLERVGFHLASNRARWTDYPL